jgi:DinB superfamily
MQVVEKLRNVLEKLPGRLQALPAESVEVQAEGSWSVKQELGHLVDSAANNHQRVVRAQLEDSPAMPGYNGEKWVELHAYQKRDWHEVIGQWSALNRLLLDAAEAVPAAGWSRTCSIGGAEPVTIQFVLEDYIEHMKGHLRHMNVQAEDLG